MGLSRTLRDAEPFRQFPDDLFAEFEKAAVVKKYPPHIHIFNQHDPPTGYLYVIKEGGRRLTTRIR
jgi:CBS domain-containing protein